MGFLMINWLNTELWTLNTQHWTLYSNVQPDEVLRVQVRLIMTQVS